MFSRDNDDNENLMNDENKIKKPIMITFYFFW